MRESNPSLISGRSSILLDCLRLLAALTVVYVHASDQWIPSKSHNPSNSTADIAHAGVVVFFVLSGFVIAYTTKSNNRGPKQYTKARLSRLYSMVAPALVISAFAQFLILNLNPALYAEYTRGASLPRYFLSFFFLNEVGFISAAPPINRPLWSLSYEFWYYAIFGLFLYKNGWKSYVLLIIACIVAGPKILVMMPIWLLGCAAYNKHLSLPNKTFAWLIVFTMLFLAAISVSFLTPFPFPLGIPPLFYANQFCTDYVIAIFIASALLVMPLEYKNYPSHFADSFRKMADLTFPIYVLHHPLLILWRGIFGYEIDNQKQMWIAILTILLVCSILGVVLEKQRYLYTRFFEWLINQVRMKLGFILNSKGRVSGTK